jgi:hypothetical protein
MNKIALIKMPKTIGFKTVSPLEQFYKKCLKKIGYSKDKKINVSAFTINPSDSDFLKSLIKKAVEIQYGFSGHKVKDTVSFEWFLNGPCESREIKIGFVAIDLENIYEREI